jgi:hypothetical protein
MGHALNQPKRYKLIAYPTASQSKLMYTLAPPPSRTARWLRRRCRFTTITPQVANAFAIVSAVKSNFISTLLLDLVQPFRWVFSSSKFFFYLFFLSPSCECGWSLFLVWFSIGLLSICFMVYTKVLNWCALFLKIIGRCMSLVIRRGACDYL